MKPSCILKKQPIKENKLIGLGKRVNKPKYISQLEQMRRKDPNIRFCPRCSLKIDRRSLKRHLREHGKHYSVEKDVSKRVLSPTTFKCGQCKVFVPNADPFNQFQCEGCHKRFHKGCVHATMFENKSYGICQGCERAREKNLELFKILEVDYKVFIPGSVYHSIYSLHSPLNEVEHNILKMSLYDALYCRNVVFNNEMYYSNINLKRKNKNSSIKNDKSLAAMFADMQEMTRHLLYPCVYLDYHPRKGFIVRAQREIDPLTLLCAYTGEVIYRKSIEKSNNPNIFNLDNRRNDHHPDKLCVRITQYGNLGFLFSGINNKDINDEANCFCISIKVQNELNLVIITSKKVMKNEELKYDYNAEREPESINHFGDFYSTKHFV